jgi:hypothetical protein
MENTKNEKQCAIHDVIHSAISTGVPHAVGAGIEDGYYALADNLPNLVNDLQKAYNTLKAKHKDQHHPEVLAIDRELKIFIEALIDGSVLGAVL